jgi:hypothetical protein
MQVCDSDITCIERPHTVRALSGWNKPEHLTHHLTKA